MHNIVSNCQFTKKHHPLQDLLRGGQVERFCSGIAYSALDDDQCRLLTSLDIHNTTFDYDENAKNLDFRLYLSNCVVPTDFPTEAPTTMEVVTEAITTTAPPVADSCADNATSTMIFFEHKTAVSDDYASTLFADVTEAECLEACRQNKVM